MTMDEVDGHLEDIPRDRDIILYCSCPNEVSSRAGRVAAAAQRILACPPFIGGNRSLAGAQISDGMRASPMIRTEYTSLWLNL